jgi:hypothetical protein
MKAVSNSFANMSMRLSPARRDVSVCTRSVRPPKRGGVMSIVLIALK